MMLQQADGLFLWATSALVNSRTVGVGEGVGVGVGVGEEVGVGVGVGVTRIDGVGVGEGVGATTGVGVGVGEGDATGEGVTRTVTPRLQTRLFPRLTQVNSLFFETTTVPTFLHVAPARGVFAEALVNEPKTKKEEITKTKTRRIREF
jgi:hypothetical protein